MKSMTGGSQPRLNMLALLQHGIIGIATGCLDTSVDARARVWRDIMFLIKVDLVDQFVVIEIIGFVRS